MVVFGVHRIASIKVSAGRRGMKWFGIRDDYLALHKEWVTDAQARSFTSDDFD
jgi:hypothetical protein